MRTLLLAIVLAVGLVAAPASAGETADQPALDSAGSPAAAPATPDPRAMMTLLAPRPDAVSFCGQCTQDSDCGTGHKCCGPSNCRECFRVATCP